MSRPRLTQKVKRVNRSKYKNIRKAFNKLKREGRLPETYTGELTYLQFKHRVEWREEAEGLSTKKAITKEMNTETFVSPAERSRRNFIQGLKEHFKDDYNDLVKKSRDKQGRFKSIMENLVWDNERKGYILGGKYFVDVSNSPEEVIIFEI